MSSIEETPVTSVDDEGRRRAQRAEQVALWRYQPIRDAADPDQPASLLGRQVGIGRVPDELVTPQRHLLGALRPSTWWCPGRLWTGGSRRGERVGSTPCCHRGARSPHALRPRYLSWPPRSSGNGPNAPAPRSRGSCAPSRGGRRRNVPCCGTSPGWSWPPARTGGHRRRSAGSKHPTQMTAGSATLCMGPWWLVVRRSCSASLTTIPGP